MRIELQDGSVLAGDSLISAIHRTDLTPVPASVELEVRDTDAVVEQLQEGATFNAGFDGDAFRVIKVERRRDGAIVQGDTDVRGARITALLDSCHQISFRRQQAVGLESTSMARVYRACGATAPVVEDFAVQRFVCLAGEVPSFAVARALQEEAAVARLSESKLRFSRIADLPGQEPVSRIERDEAENVESGFLERQTVPWFFSTNSSGAQVFGDRSRPRVAAFLPRTGPRQLNNMTRALVLRKVVTGRLAAHINAGDCVSVAGEPFVVITAAHVVESGSDGGPANQYSRLWLGVVE
jgi:hypothetical protein